MDLQFNLSRLLWMMLAVSAFFASAAWLGWATLLCNVTFCLLACLATKGRRIEAFCLWLLGFLVLVGTVHLIVVWLAPWVARPVHQPRCYEPSPRNQGRPPVFTRAGARSPRAQQNDYPSPRISHMTKLVFTLLIALAACAADGASGQEPGRFFGGGGGEALLLTQASVQKELKLNDDQTKRVTELVEKQREGFQGLRDLSREERREKMEAQRKASQTAVAEILNAEQQSRLKQISLQQRGAWAIEDPEVASVLGLSAEQKDKIAEIREDVFDELRDLREQGGGEGAREKFAELRKSGGERVEAVLSTDQQKKWKELQGPEFKGEIRWPRRGGRQR